ncbi:MAG: TolC family protein [Acidobacteriota bacterium]|jgi:outer membrane protein
MCSFRWLTILLLCGVICTIPATAEDETTRLTLSDAVKMALDRHPEIQIAHEEEMELKGKIQEVRSGAFPQVSFHGYGLRLRDPSILNSSSFDDVPPEFRDALVPRANNMFDLGVTVTQPLYTAGKIGTALDLARVSLDEKQTSSKMVRQQLTFKVFQAFHDLLLAEENHKVLVETQMLREKHLEQARNRFENGVATEVDVLRSEVHAANLEPEIIRSDNRVELARSKLNDLISVRLDMPTRIDGELKYSEWKVESLESVQDKAILNRPALESLRQQLQEARLTLSLAHAENRLSVDLEGKAGYTVRKPQNFFDNNYSKWSISVNFNLPLYDSGRKAGLVLQASARVRAMEQLLNKTENDIRLAVKQAYDAMKSSEKAIAAAELSLHQAEKVLEMMEANYKYGAATTLDVMDSQNALAVARDARITAVYDYEMAKARLRLAAGDPILDQGE